MIGGKPFTHDVKPYYVICFGKINDMYELCIRLQTNRPFRNSCPIKHFLCSMCMRRFVIALVFSKYEKLFNQSEPKTYNLLKTYLFFKIQQQNLIGQKLKIIQTCCQFKTLLSNWASYAYSILLFSLFEKSTLHFF